MATGGLDANGIWLYGEDDSEPTFSGLLNKLGTSTSNTITRLEDLSGLTPTQYETHRDNLKVGLVNVIPSSVAQAGGSASANAQGLVTFTGCTSVSLNGVFTSSYQNYRIVGSVTNSTSAGAVMAMRFRTSGTDNTTAAYTYAGALGSTGGAFSGWGAIGATYFEASKVRAFNGFNNTFQYTITRPQEALATGFSGTQFFHNGGALFGGGGGGTFDTTAQFDGITLVMLAGSFTGSVQIFAENR